MYIYAVPFLMDGKTKDADISAFKKDLEAFGLYLQLELGRGKNTRLSYVGDMKLFARFLARLGVSGFGQVEKRHVAEWIESVSSDTKAGTQSRKLSSIRAFSEFMMDEKIWTEDFSKAVARPKLRRPIPSALSISEVDSLLNSPQGDGFLAVRDRAMLELMYSSGLRVSELCSLKLSDIDFDEGFIRVRGKGDKTRLVPMGRSARDAVLKYRDILPKCVKKIKGAELFLTARGRKLSRKTFWFNIKKYARPLGLEDRVKPHILRHSFATHLLQNGANLMAIREMLGHSDLSTTQIYTKLANGTLFSEHALRHPRASMKFSFGDRSS